MAQIDIPSCPVVRPTIKEFSNFSAYVESLDKLYKHKFGMVKVVPPAEWRPRATPIENQLDHLIVQGPIEQNVSGKGNVYECLHIQKKSMTLGEYKTKQGSFDKITEGLLPKEVEKLFWRNIAFSPPLYGADLVKTLMEDRAGAWNMNYLESVLSQSIDNKVKGVNSPYCYIGSWKTLFCWHKEDLDLSAMNYLHQGKSKFWYSIPVSQQAILENEARYHFPQHFSRCSEHLRHKTTLINPYMLKKKYPELRITKIEHKVNEFILVFGGAYHCGFNFGFNIAEAVNYATLGWLKQLTQSKSCNCLHSSVRASQFEVYKNLAKTPIANSEQFKEFERQILLKEQKTNHEVKNHEQIRVVKSQFSKRIRKSHKVRKITIKGEQYKIDNWAQCDHCSEWRKVANKIRAKDSFKCNSIGRRCYERERIAKDYIQL